MKNPIQNNVKLFLILLLCLSTVLSLSQKGFFGIGPVKWELRKPHVDPPGCEKYKACDLIILEDFVEVYLYSVSTEKLVRKIKFKINTQEGLNKLKHYIVPESFEEGLSRELNFKDQTQIAKTPNVNESKVKVFAARKFSNQHWTNVNIKERYVSKKTVQLSGEFLKEDLLSFNLVGIKVGDVLELYYEIEFKYKYGNNTFYFNGSYPKISCEYNFIYRQLKSSKDMGFLLAINVDSSLIHNSKVDYNEYELVTTKIKYSDLKANTPVFRTF